VKPTRRLALRRESLTELTPDEMRLAGGQANPPTLQPGCDTDDVNWFLREVMLDVTLHPHCSWSCI